MAAKELQRVIAATCKPKQLALLEVFCKPENSVKHGEHIGLNEGNEIIK